MIYFALTDLGNIIKLDIVEEDRKLKNYVKVIENAMTLDTDKATFSISYLPKHGELVVDTITDDPQFIHDRLDKARSEIEKREIALLRNLFIIDKEEYSLKSKN